MRSGAMLAAASALLVGCAGSEHAPTAPKPTQVALREAAPRAVSCAAPPATGEAPGIDDFEGGRPSVTPNEGRGGYWFQYDDGTGGRLVRERAHGVLHVSSNGFTKWGAGFGVNLLAATTLSRACDYDASVYSGIEFRARGRGRMRLMLVGKAHTPKSQGGTCELPGERCFDRPGVWVNLTEQWQQFEYPYCRFAPEGWGEVEAPLEPDHLVSLHVRAEAGHDFELWLDDLAFFEAKRGESLVCDPPCPLEAAPRSAHLDAKFTRAKLTESFTLSTFEQPTARCGNIVRRYLSYVPKKLGKSSTAPVVFMLHGTGANAESSHRLMTRGRLTELAERDGFVVVYGNAAPGAATDPSADFPNTGAWRQALADDGQVDDVDYLLRVVRDLEKRHIIAGGNPVFLSGLSNGGGMVLEAGREAPDQFRGIAALMPFDGRHPAPVPDLRNSGLSRVMFVYSRSDPGLVEGYGAVLDSLPATWARALGMPDAAIENPASKALVDRVQEGAHYEGDNRVALATRNSTGRQLDMTDPTVAGKVRVIVFDHAGHFWPTPVQDTQAWIVDRWGFRNQDIDAADAIWEFFRTSL